MTHNFPLPPNFVESLLELTFSILIKKPINYMEFCSKYFVRIANKEAFDTIFTEEVSRLSQESSTESLEDSPDPEQYMNKRHSVAAEKFNPEEINMDDYKIEFHEKTPQQRDKLKSVCQKIAVFSSLKASDLNTIVDAMFQVNIGPGEDLIEEGDDGDNFYVIESGVFEAYVTISGEEKMVKTYDNEGSFGELALIYNAPRAATIKAKTDGVVWAVTRQVFRSVVLVKAAQQRTEYNKILEQVPMLQTLSDFERTNIADALTSRDCEPDEIVIKEGDPGNQMFFIIKGEIEIFKELNGKKQVIVTLSKGNYFGELALLSNKPRAASARATKPTELAILDVKSFERLMGPCIEIMKRNMNDYKKQVVKVFNS